MTAFDALMPGALDAAPAGRRSGAGAGTGDWRQAVEQAQAKSWLGDRNVDAGSGGASPGRGDAAPTRDAATLPSRHAWIVEGAAPRLEGRSAERVSPLRRDEPAPHLATRSVQAPLAMPQSVAASTQVVQATRAVPDATAQSVASNYAAYALAARPRKQSLHVETGEQGISVWLRDTALNSQQANHLAAAIISNLEGGGQQLAALYLNGRAVTDGPASASPLLSSTNPSE